MGTIILVSHSSQPLFIISCNISAPLFPRCLIRSIGRPEHPAAFPFFMLCIAIFTSSFDISRTGPSTAGTSPSCALAFSTFSRLLKYSIYTSLIFTSSVRISLCCYNCLLAGSIGHRPRNATDFCPWPSSPFLSWCI